MEEKSYIHLTGEQEKEKLDSSLALVRQKIESGMKNAADLIVDEYTINGISILVVMFDGLVSNTQVSDFLLRPLAQVPQTENSPEKLWNYLNDHRLMSSEQGSITDYRTLFTKAMSGFAILLIDGWTEALSFGYQGFQTRGVGEPSAEKNLRGSREGFTESNNINTALVRRRLKSPNLMVENLTIGTVSQSNVRLLYLSDIASPEMVKRVKEDLAAVKMDVVLDSGFLQPFLEKGKKSFFSGTGVTQRPDTLCAKLVEGRVGLMVDGSPSVMVAPYLFLEHFQSLDDYTQRPYFATFIRLLKLFAFFMTIFLPGVYVAIVSFHPELIPPILLGSFISSVNATPMPVMLEALILFILYELLREAGLRLPEAIGHTLGIVGGIIIGDAAVTAGLIGLPLVIVIALTAVSAFVIPSLYEAITILRFLFIIIGGILGLFGIFLGFVLLIADICAVRSLGVPISAPVSPLNLHAWRDLFWRSGWEKLQEKTYSIGKSKD